MNSDTFNNSDCSSVVIHLFVCLAHSQRCFWGLLSFDRCLARLLALFEGWFPQATFHWRLTRNRRSVFSLHVVMFVVCVVVAFVVVSLLLDAVS